MKRETSDEAETSVVAEASGNRTASVQVSFLSDPFARTCSSSGFSDISCPGAFCLFPFIPLDLPSPFPFPSISLGNSVNLPWSPSSLLCTPVFFEKGHVHKVEGFGGMIAASVAVSNILFTMLY